MFRNIPSTFLLAVLLTACLSPSPTPLATPKAHPSNLPELGGTWNIKMSQSGGIMGMSRSIEILSDGSFELNDLRAETTVDGRLTNTEMTSLRELVTKAELMPLPAIEEAGCADCFIYNLEIQGSDKPFSIQLNDISLPDSGLESLVGFLRTLMDQALR